MREKQRTAKQALSAVRSLPEIPLQQSLEGLAVPRLVPGHFMHGVMDGVQAEFLGFLGQIGLLNEN